MAADCAAGFVAAAFFGVFAAAGFAVAFVAGAFLAVGFLAADFDEVAFLAGALVAGAFFAVDFTGAFLAVEAALAGAFLLAVLVATASPRFVEHRPRRPSTGDCGRPVTVRGVPSRNDCGNHRPFTT